MLVFNNGVGRPGGSYSSVDEIVPPVDENGNYSLVPGSAYDPKEQLWIYTADNPPDFFAQNVGGAQRLNDGNTLICDGPAGVFFEVTSENVIVWQYENPYPHPLNNNVFKIQYLPPEEPSPQCGDANNDGIINVGDVVYLITYLYRGGSPPIPTTCIGDVNCDDIVNVGDVVYLITYLYRGGALPCPDCCS
jgi:hypothetical protein